MKKQTQKLVEYGEAIKQEEKLAKITREEIESETTPVTPKFSFKHKIIALKQTLKELLRKDQKSSMMSEYVAKSAEKTTNMFIEELENDIRTSFINENSLLSFIKKTERYISQIKHTRKWEWEKEQELSNQAEELKTVIQKERKKWQKESQTLIKTGTVNEGSIEEDMHYLKGKDILYTTKTSAKTYKSKVKDVRYEEDANQYVMSIEFDDKEAKNKGTGAYFKLQNKKDFLEEINSRLQMVLELKNTEAQTNLNAIETKRILLDELNKIKDIQFNNNQVTIISIPITQTNTDQEKKVKVG